MRVLILGGDGYLGWPTAMAFANKGHDVTVIDNYLRRNIARETCSEALMDNPNLLQRAAVFRSHFGKTIDVVIGDCADYRVIEDLVGRVQPDAIVHYAEQPSAPYSMKGFEEAHRTFHNNLSVTFNVIWAIIRKAPRCHLVKLGTMGEYGTPNIDIEEGWLDVEHNGRRQRFLYPRQAGSLYHTTKVLDTDLLWFYVRLYGIAVTDLMQGPVYGIHTSESLADVRLFPNFHYDDIFGTVVNRFLVQAVAGIPLTVYGKGGQVRGYLNLLDTLQCVELAVSKPAPPGELRIFNQFTERFSVNELADRVREASAELGLRVEIRNVENPRKEAEEHYYNPRHHALIDLGLKPHLMTKEVLVEMMRVVEKYRDRIDTTMMAPRVKWS